MEDNFSPQHSLQLIQSMIDKTKTNMGDNRFYFLLWGWLAFIGGIGQFILKVLVHYPYHYAIWCIIIIGIVWSFLYTRRKHKKHRARTYIGDSMRYLWAGLGISFFVFYFIMGFYGIWQYAYPIFITLYGLGTYISGRILQFKPLVIGDIVSWLLACIAVFFDFDYQMLFAALAILVSYIVPGYLLKSNTEFKNETVV